MQIRQARVGPDNRIEMKAYRREDQSRADKPSRRLLEVAQERLGASPRGDDVATGAKAELPEVDRGLVRIRRLAGRADFQFGSG